MIEWHTQKNTITEHQTAGNEKFIKMLAAFT